MKNIEEALAEQVVSKLPEPSSYYLYQEKLRSESQYSGLLGHTLALDKKFLLEYIPIPLHVKYETPGGGKEALLTRLNLGCEYQPIIQQFITYAHEIRVIATDLFMKYKEKESNRRENARIRAQNALKRRQPSENMSRKVPCSLTHSLADLLTHSLTQVLAEEIVQDKEPSVSLAQELWKSKRENSMLQLAMGADTSKPDSFDKSEISNFDDFPTIMHQVRSIGYNHKLLSLLLDTYLGLGSVLMLRADLYAQAIRDLERGSQLNYSVLTISQRWNGDVEDLIDDVYAEMMGESDKREAILKKLADKRQQANNLLARTETMKVEGEDEYMLPLDDEAAVEETKTKGASKSKKTEQKKAVDTTVVDAADDVPDEGFPTISKDDAVTCIEYLVQIRTHILAWAFKVLDAVSDILHELGCDTIDTPKDDSYFTLTSGISKYRNHIIRFYYVRARCLQSLRKFKEAMALYQACINLSKNKSIRKYRIERIKCLLELKELKEARDMITELIYDEISSPYDPFPKVLDILKANKEFGTWFLYIDVYETEFKRAGMYDNLQHLTYQVNDLGLLTQPPDRLYFDQANGYRPVHRLIKESIIRAEERKISEETEMKDRQVVHVKASNVHKKYQKILAETKAELNVYLEMEQKEQAENTNRISVKKGKK
jgi:tetratricopeptide (TPR) repeat protein